MPDNLSADTSQRGNILFFILLAVALFAALSFAVTRGSRNSNTNIMTEEQARLNANGIIEYGNALRSLIDQFMLMNGVSDTNTASNGILFSATGANASYGVVNAQPATELFNQSGGKVTYQSPPSGSCLSACAYEFSGQYTVTGVSNDTKSELAMLVIDVPQTLCQKANDIMNTGLATIPTGAALTLTRFNGTNYGDAGGANPITLNGTFAGKRGFCYKESSGAGRYIIVYVIRSR